MIIFSRTIKIYIYVYRKKEYEKLNKYQELKEEIEKMWKVRAKIIPVTIRALGVMIPKLEKWL